MSPSYSAKRPELEDIEVNPKDPARSRDPSPQRSLQSLKVRIASGDRTISTAGRLVRASEIGATIEVMFPSRGPSVIMVYFVDDSEIYESEVRWRTDWRIGVRFLDVLGSVRRRLFFNDQPVPLQPLPNRILRLAEAPNESEPSEPGSRRVRPRSQTSALVAFRNWIDVKR